VARREDAGTDSHAQGYRPPTGDATLTEQVEELVDPNSDEELAETPTYTIREWIKYWKWAKSEEHHFKATGQRVDRHRQIERMTAVVNSRRDKGPGRPLGFQVEDHTKAQISYSKTEVKRAATDYGNWPSPPPCDDDRVPFDTRMKAAIRDNYQCCGCKEHYRIRYWKKPGERKKYWTKVANGKEVIEIQHHQDIRMYLVPGGDPREPDHLLTLCGFCRNSAKTMGTELGVGIKIVVEDRADDE
jgi:hypothetical protein